MKYTIKLGQPVIPSVMYVDGVIEPKEGVKLKSQMVVAIDKSTYSPVAYANTGERGEFYFRVANLNLLTVICFDRTDSYSATLVDNVTPAITT
ncbi:hypothetical protein H4J63_02160 [Pseudoalteromonas sp. 5Ae-yellow]|uniref:hypothetical protein n=1 Tax=Pseudoalteromonas sp. 5Ae-yellow TaxID=2759847 RepID=UPI0015F394A9|nr:hypothetical protein [Pseudoalteromonas sp. 5Ae-yellow]MBA6408172.1 hypothetical protein [Pseudoalteromonas sp. 5Ae-yellow]